MNAIWPALSKNIMNDTASMESLTLRGIGDTSEAPEDDDESNVGTPAIVIAVCADWGLSLFNEKRTMLFVRLLVISLAAYFLAVSAAIVCGLWMFTEQLQLQLSAEAKAKTLSDCMYVTYKYILYDTYRTIRYTARVTCTEIVQSCFMIHVETGIISW